MQAVGFKAWCPYEIGDRVKVCQCGDLRVMEITDILTQMSAKTGAVRFLLELDNGEKYVSLQAL